MSPGRHARSPGKAAREYLEKRGLPEDQWERITRFKIYAYAGQVARAEQEIEWARHGLRLLEELGELDGPDDEDTP